MRVYDSEQIIVSYQEYKDKNVICKFTLESQIIGGVGINRRVSEKIQKYIQERVKHVFKRFSRQMFVIVYRRIRLN